MNLHEYQSKQVFAEYGIPCPQGIVISSKDDVNKIIDEYGDTGCIIKAQVHTGGRGKVGGVIKADNAAEITAAVDKLLGAVLATHQTGPQGLPINSVLAEPLSSIEHEYYLSLLVDRTHKRIAIVASEAGGMDIEEVAEKTPEKIHTEFVDPAAGLQPYQSRNLGFKMGLNGKQVRQFGQILQSLYDMFNETDASMIEINPLAANAEGNLYALDAKVNLDPNAMYRQKELEEIRDYSQEDAREVEASKHELNYIALEGDIGCMVNGAGLAMATMDLIKLEGGSPANFLDVGGGATKERVANAFKLILSDSSVKAVLVNIFGGIVRCDLIAEGIIAAVQEVGVSIPVVVRLEGTNVNEGRELLANSGLAIIPVENLAEAAKTVVAEANGEK